jgi:hypothetical protein
MILTIIHLVTEEQLYVRYSTYTHISSSPYYSMYVRAVAEPGRQAEAWPPKHSRFHIILIKIFEFIIQKYQISLILY